LVACRAALIEWSIVRGDFFDLHCVSLGGDFLFASCFQFNFAGNENSFDSCKDGTPASRTERRHRPPTFQIGLKNARIEDRIEPLSPDKLRDTLSANLRGII
jgi:hypothetical protein